MTTRTHGEFFAAVLSRLALPNTIGRRRAVACVSIFESSQGNERWNNPLAVTLYWPNATAYNTFGQDQHVWRYSTFSDGVHATARLLSGSHWDGVRAAIRSNRYRNPILDAFTTAYTWARFDFRRAPFNTIQALDARLAHPLYGPND